MKDPDEHVRDIEALRERLSRLNEANLRINESLDFDTVLQGVLDSARSLTGALYGIIVLLDDSAEIQDFLSSGLTSEQAQGVWNLSEGVRLFEHLGESSEPMRVDDFQSHVRALGLPEFKPPLPVSGSMPLLAAPIVHLGERVGIIFMGDREGEGTFTPQDEETFVMFAAQAALVIANARRHRSEQQARANLETLIDTSPVGVVVFDARTGAPVSFNREAGRIVGVLQPPGRPPEQLLEVLTFRRADGREISLQEFPMAQVLTGETIRAEEVVIQVPGGRSITTLINATPIYSEGGGELESVVVTIQDMTPLEEMERLRAELLGVVSHELRTPLAAIRGSATTMLDDESALDPAEMRQFHRIIVDQADRMRALINDLLDVARIETGTLSISPETLEAAVLVDEARNTFLSAGGRNNVLIEVPPGTPLVLADRRRIVQVLGNLLTNAGRHSSESSVIRVSAVRQGVHVAISVADEGRGIPADRMAHLFRKFSRIEPEDQGGDTGLGLAVCKGIVEAHGGRIWAESEGVGLGARFTFTLPAAEGAATAGPEAISGRAPRPGRDLDRILVVDDDPQTLRYVRDALSKAGYSPTVTADPEEVPRLMGEEEPQLVLLDLMLPGTDGIILMKSIREMADVPVIFISAYGQDQVIARAFDMGAADYVVKPFSPTELAARIRAALRRQAVPALDAPSEPYLFGALGVDYAQRRVTVAGAPVDLTDIEYRMLAELSANAGRIMTHEQLLRRVWGQDTARGSGPVRAIVKRLRRKLGDDAADPTYIFNKRRVGYWMEKGEG